MNSIEPLTVIVGIAITVNIFLIIRWFYFQEFKKCGGKFKKIFSKYSMGINLSKSVTVSNWKGPRKNTGVWSNDDSSNTSQQKH